MEHHVTLGRLAVLMAVSDPSWEGQIFHEAQVNHYLFYKGRVGSMDGEKVFAAVETAAKRRGLVHPMYRDEHALYHSTLDAFEGVCRGQIALREVLRSAGLVFSIVRGPRLAGDSADGDWLAVAMFGTVGAPIKGFEHEAVGLGINNV